MNPKILDDLARKISDAMPQALTDLHQDVEKTVRATLQSTFSKMNLVTREEFEVQAKVLAATRAKLDRLEKEIAELEKLSGAARPERAQSE